MNPALKRMINLCLLFCGAVLLYTGTLEYLHTATSIPPLEDLTAYKLMLVIKDLILAFGFGIGTIVYVMSNKLFQADKKTR